MKYFKLLSLLLLVFSMQSCDDDTETTISTPLAIGDWHQGGIIFYLDATLTHGYICTAIGQSNGTEWGCQPSVVTGANGVEIGSGAQNTLDIIDVCSSLNIAAAICNQLKLNNYDDWFLPSKDELDLIFQNKDIVNTTALANGGELLQETNYWTSTHLNSNTVWVQFFGSGGRQYGNSENESNHVRAIRAF